jgi:DNA-binding transcriptional ArsR family regulator
MALAERVLVLPRIDLDGGRWSPAPIDGSPAALALLLDGLVGRHVALGDRVATQLLGPGDVFDPWSTPGAELLPCPVQWSAFGAATVAVLDMRFATAARRWPGLATTAQERLLRLTERLAVHIAICQLPRVEQRVLALLWHLAERFGRVAPDGIVLETRLTHRLIGELVGAQRPTVSLALANLLDDGLVTRREDGALALDRRSRAALASNGAPAPPVAPARSAAAPTGDLLERVRMLHADIGAERAGTITAVAHSATLRRELAGRSPAPDGEAA